MVDKELLEAIAGLQAAEAEKLPGAEDLDAMQEQLDLHYAMLKKHTREISDLKKAN